MKTYKCSINLFVLLQANCFPRELVKYFNLDITPGLSSSVGRKKDWGPKYLGFKSQLPWLPRRHEVKLGSKLQIPHHLQKHTPKYLYLCVNPPYKAVLIFVFSNWLSCQKYYSLFYQILSNFSNIIFIFIYCVRWKVITFKIINT